MFRAWRGARPDIQAQYDLASLGEVETLFVSHFLTVQAKSLAKYLRRTTVDIDGQRAAIASQVAGVLAAVVNSDFPDPPDSLSGRIAIYPKFRNWAAKLTKFTPHFPLADRTSEKLAEANVRGC